MTEILNVQLLEEFMYGFYGYGDYRGQYWFVGMEESGGNSLKDISDRLNAWQKRGKRELEDLVEYHCEIGPTRWFNDRPRLQPTWNKLIRILLSSNDHILEKEEVRKYQKESLGRLNGETCLLELLPLPSPSTNDWSYANIPRIPYLANREIYKDTLRPCRILHLGQRINEYKPKAVIFYGFGYLEDWEKIAEKKLKPEEVNLPKLRERIYIERCGSTLFVITQHPSTRGVTNEYFHQVGKTIKERM